MRVRLKRRTTVRSVAGGALGARMNSTSSGRIAPLGGIRQARHVTRPLGRGAGGGDQRRRAEDGGSPRCGRTEAGAAGRQATTAGWRAYGREASPAARRQDDDRRRQADHDRRRPARRASVGRAVAGGAGRRTGGGDIPRPLSAGASGTGSVTITAGIGDAAWALAADRTIHEPAGTAALNEPAGTGPVEDATAARHGHAGWPAGKALEGGSAAGRHAEARAALAQSASPDADAADGDAELRLGRPDVHGDPHGGGGERREQPRDDAATGARPHLGWTVVDLPGHDVTPRNFGPGGSGSPPHVSV